MPGTVPKDARPLAEFARARLTPWTEHIAAIGVPPAVLAEVTARTPELEAAIRAANEARLAAQAATDAMNVAARQLFESAAIAVRSIRTHASATDDPKVYGLAQIDPPRGRARVADAPSTPTQLTASVDRSGAVTLTWRTRQPRGVSNVVYEVRRSLELGSVPTDIIALASGRTFRDETVPLGTTRVAYMLTARRGGQESLPSEIAWVQIGSAPIAATSTAMRGQRAA